jgi:glycosyl hydrolase family 26
MPPRLRLVLALLAVLLLTAPAAARADVMYWGALVKGDAYGLPGEAPTSAAVLNRFEADAGKQMTIVNTGQSWVGWDPASMDAAIAAGEIPLVTMSLAPGVSLKEVVEGKQDAAIRSWARAAKAFAYPFLFRPWWEMNGNWYSWGRSPDFIAAWRHFHDLVVAEGATNVTWAWVVNTIWEENGEVQADPAPYYPGDAYVDWTGVDAYNWGRNPLQPDRWVSAEESIEPTLEVLEEVAPDKPVCICESASTEIGEGGPEEDKALWIEEMLGEYLPSRPQIKAYVWFNWNVEQGGFGSGGGHWDWPIESSPEAEDAFRDGIQGETFLSVLPPLTRLAKLPMPAWPPDPPPVDPPPAGPPPGSEPPPDLEVSEPPVDRGQLPADPGRAPTAATQAGQAPADPLAFGAAERSGRRGGAILPLTLAGPGRLHVSGRGLRVRILPSRHLLRSPLSRWIPSAGELRLEVRAAGPKQRRLTVTVRFAPATGEAEAETRRIALT